MCFENNFFNGLLYRYGFMFKLRNDQIKKDIYN